MPGWLSSAGFGPLTSMLWNATSTACISHKQKRENLSRRRRGQNREPKKEERNENQSDQPICGRPRQGPALLYGGPGLCKEGGFQPGPISMADRGVCRGSERRRHGQPSIWAL